MLLHYKNKNDINIVSDNVTNIIVVLFIFYYNIKIKMIFTTKVIMALI